MRLTTGAFDANVIPAGDRRHKNASWRDAHLSSTSFILAAPLELYAANWVVAVVISNGGKSYRLTGWDCCIIGKNLNS